MPISRLSINVPPPDSDNHHFDLLPSPFPPPCHPSTTNPHLVQTHSQLLSPAYLTETPYLARDDPSLGAGAREQLPRSAKSLDLDLELEPGLLSDKPTLPVLDTRRANFLLGAALSLLLYLKQNHNLISEYVFSSA